MVSKLVGAATTCCNLPELFFTSVQFEPPSVDLKIYENPSGARVVAITISALEGLAITLLT